MVELWNRHTNRQEPVELREKIDADDIACFEQHWLPPMEAKIEELRAAGTLTRESVEKWNVTDAHWKWGSKFQSRRGELKWASYALRSEGLTQGMMFLNLIASCRLQSQLNQHMVYVDLVSTAPWNRPRFTPEPKFGGVGLVLVTEAIVRSFDEGFEGRIGLHSVAGAEAFYRDKLRMDCLGPDSKAGGLPYYEMTSQRAAQLLAQNS
jgi:hypothetical protein